MSINVDIIAYFLKALHASTDRFFKFQRRFFKGYFLEALEGSSLGFLNTFQDYKREFFK